MHKAKVCCCERFTRSDCRTNSLALVEGLDDDDFIEDFAEISTIALPDDSDFVINDDVLVPTGDQGVTADASDDGKPKEDVKIELVDFVSLLKQAFTNILVQGIHVTSVKNS